MQNTLKHRTSSKAFHRWPKLCSKEVISIWIPQTFRTFMWWYSLVLHTWWHFSKSMDLVRLALICSWLHWSFSGHFWREEFFSWTTVWYGEHKREKLKMENWIDFLSQWLIALFRVVTCVCLVYAGFFPISLAFIILEYHWAGLLKPISQLPLF